MGWYKEFFLMVLEGFLSNEPNIWAELLLWDRWSHYSLQNFTGKKLGYFSLGETFIGTYRKEIGGFRLCKIRLLAQHSIVWHVCAIFDGQSVRIICNICEYLLLFPQIQLMLGYLIIIYHYIDVIE